MLQVRPEPPDPQAADSPEDLGGSGVSRSPLLLEDRMDTAVIVYRFLQDHWGEISTVLFLTSEVLGSVPWFQHNSIFQAIFSLLKKEKP